MTIPVSTAFDLMRQYGLDPKQSLGQNWLVDESHLARIAAAADLCAADTVLEIGPGLGNLTHYLAAQAGRVIAVELDDRLIPILRHRFAHQPHVEIVHGNILEIDAAQLIGGRDWEIGRVGDWGGERQTDTQSPNLPISQSSVPPPATRNSQLATPYKVVANLPYYITSAVLRHLLEAAHPPTLAVLLVQKEVAQRICAEPGEMSILAVSVQFYAQPKIVQKVPAGAFHPRPKVDSAVVRLDMYPQPAVADVEPDWFFTVVRAGFGQKRKQLLNSLSAGMGRSKEGIEAALHTAGIDPKRRAQTLSIDEWGALCRTLNQV